jgi:hypothetical protein
MRKLLALTFLSFLFTQTASAFERDTSIDGWWESNEGPKVTINGAPPAFSGSRIYFATRGRRLCVIENKYFSGALFDSILYLGVISDGKGEVYKNRILDTAVSKREWSFADPVELYVGATNIIFRKVPPKEKGYPLGTFYFLLQRATQLQTPSPHYSGGFALEKDVTLVNEEDVCKKELASRALRTSRERKSRD